MAKRKPKIMETIKPHLLKIVLGLSTLGAASTGGLAYSKGESIDIKVAKTEVKIEALKDAGLKTDQHMDSHDRALNRLDRRTTRIEAQQDLMLDALKVPMKKRPLKEED